MNEERAKQLIKGVLTQKRFEHSLRVADVAKELALRYGASVDNAVLAALLHDYAKCQPRDQLKNQIIKYGLPQQLLQFHHELWHGPVAAKVMEIDFGISDKHVLDAIYYHTTARASMSLLEVVIFVADYIEPQRNVPGIEEVRELATSNIYIAARKAMQNTIIYLIQKDATIHPDSFLAYNDWTNKM